jgi:hypothetical protein
MYNKEHQERLKLNALPNSEDFKFTPMILGRTKIDISGKVCEVVVCRNENGNIEVTPTDSKVWEENGWLYNGSCTEGYNDEVIISQFNY